MSHLWLLSEVQSMLILLLALAPVLAPRSDSLPVLRHP